MLLEHVQLRVDVEVPLHAVDEPVTWYPETGFSTEPMVSVSGTDQNGFISFSTVRLVVILKIANGQCDSDGLSADRSWFAHCHMYVFAEHLQRTVLLPRLSRGVF